MFLILGYRKIIIYVCWELQYSILKLLFGMFYGVDKSFSVLIQY